MSKANHVAIIMDGNGRWAQSRSRPRTYGHIQGARVAKKIITAAVERGLSHLTLFAFSTENWQRPKTEVSFLMRLLAHQIRREQKTLMTNNVRFSTIGDLSALPNFAKQVVVDATKLTEDNTGLRLIFALNYGGQQEILNAVKKVAAEVQRGALNPEELTQETFSSFLDTHAFPPPDLIIRTSGEKRISNFILWSSAYSEMYFVEKHWPDFTAYDFDLALADFTKRSRRFGKVLESIPPVAVAP